MYPAVCADPAEIVLDLAEIAKTQQIEDELVDFGVVGLDLSVPRALPTDLALTIVRSAFTARSPRSREHRVHKNTPGSELGWPGSARGLSSARGG